MPPFRHAEAEQRLLKYGRNELEEKTQSKLIIFLKGVSSPVGAQPSPITSRGAVLA